MCHQFGQNMILLVGQVYKRHVYNVSVSAPTRSKSKVTWLTCLLNPVQVSDCGVLSINSPSGRDSDFLPVFRSGSCAEKGVKQFMEDEHICIDNLVEELGAGAPATFPRAGAFYGVSYFIVSYCSFDVEYCPLRLLLKLMFMVGFFFSYYVMCLVQCCAFICCISD